MKGKGPSASRVRVEAVSKAGFGAGALIEKRKRADIGR